MKRTVARTEVLGLVCGLCSIVWPHGEFSVLLMLIDTDTKVWTRHELSSGFMRSVRCCSRVSSGVLPELSWNQVRSVPLEPRTGKVYAVTGIPLV